MLVGLLGAFALVLGVAGAMKFVAPEATMRAIVATKLPVASMMSNKPTVRAFAIAEVAVALLVILVGGWVPALLLAVAFAFLALIAGRLVRHAPGQDCGCFGRSFEPATKWHVGVNSVAGIVAVAAVAQPQRSLSGAAVDLGAGGVVLLIGVVLLGWLVYLTTTALPDLLTLRAEVGTR